MIPPPDESPDELDVSHFDAQLADLLTTHRTEEMAVEDAKVVAAFYVTLADKGVCLENEDVVSLTHRWMAYTWNGGDV